MAHKDKIKISYLVLFLILLTPVTSYRELTELFIYISISFISSG